MGHRFLIDNSAWSRLGHGGLSQERVEELAEAVAAGEVFVCLPFLLEAGFSARSFDDHVSGLDQLRTLPEVSIDADVEKLALKAQRELARSGHHRMPPTDILIAALADSAELGVLHYDADYDRIAQHSDLLFDSVWLAPRGSL